MEREGDMDSGQTAVTEVLATLADRSASREAWQEAAELLCWGMLEGDATPLLDAVAASMASWSAEARIVMLDALIDHHIACSHPALLLELENMLCSSHRRSFMAAMMALHRCLGVSGEALTVRCAALPEDHRVILAVFLGRQAPVRSVPDSSP